MRTGERTLKIISIKQEEMVKGEACLGDLKVTDEKLGDCT